MQHSTSILPHGDGDSLFIQHWSAPRKQGESNEPASAKVLIVHGLGEHSGRYADFAAHLVSQGYDVTAFDLPGHGKSTGLRGYISRFDLYRQAVKLVTKSIKAQDPEVPIYLLGHSMGGLVSTLTLLKGQAHYAGCVLSGSAFDTTDPPGLLQQLLLRAFSRLFPGLGVLALDAMDVSRDPEVVSLYSNDPLNYRGKFSARLVVELFKAMKSVREAASAINIPMLVMHGEADKMTPWQGSKAFYESIASGDKTLKILPGLYHEILNEPEKQEVYSMISDWLTLHQNAAAGSAEHQVQGTT